MHRTLSAVLAVSVVSTVSVAQEPTFPTPSVGASATQLTQMFSDYWEWRLAASPELATEMGRHEYGDRWTDWSRAAREKARAHRKDLLQQLLYVNSAGNLTDSMRLSANLLEWELRAALDMEAYQDLVNRISQQFGLHVEVFSVIAAMPSR